MKEIDVLIIGGGISGLATAWHLSQAGLNTEVWESKSAAGGKIKTTREGGYLTERAATLIMEGRAAGDLVRETGLGSATVRRGPMDNRYLLKENTLRKVPAELGRMITSDLWSLRGKLQMMTEPLKPGRPTPGESVSGFISRRLGNEILETAIEPYIAGPLAADPDFAEAWATLPKLTALERRYGSIAVGVLVKKITQRRQCEPKAFSFAEGMSTLINSITDTRQFSLQTHCQARHVHRHVDHWEAVATQGGREQSLRAKQIVFSTPAPTSAALLATSDPTLSKLLSGITYAPISIVHLGFSRDAITHPLDGAGFLTPRSAQLPINGCLWSSSTFNHRAPKGRELLTLYMGGARRPEAAKWSDQRSLECALSAISPLLGIKGDPEMGRVDRHPQGLPLYYGNYSDRLIKIKTQLSALPGIHLCANYIGGISVRDRIENAEKTASAVLGQLGQTRNTPSIKEQQQANPESRPLTTTLASSQ